jgi:hypothetical protein
VKIALDGGSWTARVVTNTVPEVSEDRGFFLEKELLNNLPQL